MKHEEKIFKLLKDCAETSQEILAVDEMISKVENKILPIETVNDTKKIFNDFNFYKNKKKVAILAQLHCIVLFGNFTTEKFLMVMIFTTAILIKKIMTLE